MEATGGRECAQCGPGTRFMTFVEGADASLQSATCETCAVGQFAVGHGETQCTPCEAGKFGSGGQAAATHCQTCLEGSYAEGLANTACTECAAGQYGSGLDRSLQAHCQDCATGHFSANASATICVPCAAGRFGQGVRDGTYCEDCAAGSYQTQAAQETCLSCLPGTYGVGDQTVATYCIACAAGRYQPATDKTSCIYCPAGTFGTGPVDTVGHCTNCVAGTASQVTAALSCAACATGRYQPYSGEVICYEETPCAGNERLTQAATPTSDAVCGVLTGCQSTEYETAAPTDSSDRVCAAHTPCPAGQFESQAPGPFNDRTCADVGNACVAGTFERAGPSGTSPRICQPCGVGRFQVSSGQTHCDVCAPGHFQERAGQDHCTPCLAGQHQPFAAQAGCTMTTVCSATQYEKQAPTATSNRQCRRITTCAPNMYQVAAPTATSNRQCAVNNSNLQSRRRLRDEARTSRRLLQQQQQEKAMEAYAVTNQMWQDFKTDTSNACTLPNTGALGTNGGVCSFYPSCAEKNIPCGSSGYFKDYGLKYCQRFTAHTYESSYAQSWRDETLKCLQSKLKSSIMAAKPTSCASIANAAFDQHVVCYTQEQASICNVCEHSFNDLMKIPLTLDMEEYGDPRSYKQMWGVLKTCVPQVTTSQASNCAANLAKASYQLAGEAGLAFVEFLHDEMSATMTYHAQVMESVADKVSEMAGEFSDFCSSLWPWRRRRLIAADPNEDKCPCGWYETAAPTQTTGRQCEEVSAPCAPGTYQSVNPSHAQDRVCTACAPGKYSAKWSQTACIPCARGKFQPIGGSTTCTACSAGSAAADRNQVECTECEAGTFAHTAGMRECEACVPGQVSVDGALGCSSCPPGTFASNTGNDECTPCAAGTFNPTAGADACMAVTECEDVDGETEINTGSPGPVYTEIVVPTATTDRVCATAMINGACTASQFESNGMCQPLTVCTAEQFEMAAPTTTTNRMCGNHATGPCPYGQFEVTPASATQDSVCAAYSSACAAGTYENRAPSATKDRQCLPCARGYFSANAGADACQQCTEGSTTAADGATTASLCLPCPNSQIVSSSDGSCLDPTASGSNMNIAGAMEGAFGNMAAGLKSQLDAQHMFSMGGLPEPVQTFLSSAGLNSFNVVVAQRKVMSVEAHFGGTAGAKLGAGLEAPGGVTASIWMTRKPDVRRRLSEQVAQTGHTCPSGPACGANAQAVITLASSVGACPSDGAGDSCTSSNAGKACTLKTSFNQLAGAACAARPDTDPAGENPISGKCAGASNRVCCDSNPLPCNAAADVKAVRDRLYELGYSYVGEPSQTCVYSTLQSCADTTWGQPGSTCGTNCMNFLKRAIRIFTCVTDGDSKLGNTNPSNTNTWGDMAAGCGSETIEPGSTFSAWLASPNAPAWVQLTKRTTAADFPQDGKSGCGYTAKSSGGDLCNAQVGLDNLAHAGHDWKLAEEAWDAHKWGTSWAHSIFSRAGAKYGQWRATQANYGGVVGKWPTELSGNDATMPFGGDTPDHKSHETGGDFDIRMGKTGGTSIKDWSSTTTRSSTGGFNWCPSCTNWDKITSSTAGGSYDRTATREMIKAFWLIKPVPKAIYFNDPVLGAETIVNANGATVNLCTYSGGHNNHFHVAMPGGFNGAGAGTGGTKWQRTCCTLGPTPAPPPSPLPTPAPTPAAPAAFTLIKLDHECNSADEYLDTYATQQECANKCAATPGCSFFVYGKGMFVGGRCYWEKTATAACSEGWDSDSYDSLQLGGATPAPTPVAGGAFVPAAPDTSQNTGACTTAYQQFAGHCINVAGCTGGTFKGLCAGSSSIMCCVPETNGTPVQTPPQMTFATFQSVFEGISATRAAALYPYFLTALTEGPISSCDEIAAFVAQIGHESHGLLYFEELASGEAYNGRADLGNTQAGDGPRFKGRGPIQLTGRANYRDAGNALGMDFEARPEQVSLPSAGFKAAVWFWTNKNLNQYCTGQASDFTTLTSRINGGQNGAADRVQRWNAAKTLLQCDGGPYTTTTTTTTTTPSTPTPAPVPCRRLQEGSAQTGGCLVCDLAPYGTPFDCGQMYAGIPRSERTGTCGPSWSTPVGSGTEQCVLIDGKKVTTKMACEFLDMKAAAATAGHTLTITQGFRTMADQTHFWDCYQSGGTGSDTNTPPRACNGQSSLAACPGTSKHQIGVAFDIVQDMTQDKSSKVGYTLGSTIQPIYGWLRDHAWEFNFIRTVKSEAWHWEYHENRQCEIDCMDVKCKQLGHFDASNTRACMMSNECVSGDTVSGKCLSNSAASYTCCKVPSPSTADEADFWDDPFGAAYDYCMSFFDRRRRLVESQFAGNTTNCTMPDDDVIVPTPAPMDSSCCLFCGATCNKGCCLFDVKVELTGSVMLGNEVPLSLSATYDTAENGVVRLSGRCGSVTGGACMTNLFGVNGLALAEVGVGAVWHTTNSTSLQEFTIDGAIRHGSTTHLLAGEFFKTSSTATSMDGFQFAMPQLGGVDFTDMIGRTTTSQGPDWLANSPSVPNNIAAGIAFTNVNRGRSFTPCAGCAVQPIKQGLNIYVVKTALPATTISNMQSVGFMDGMEGVLWGNIKIGFAGSDFANSGVGFSAIGTWSLNSKVDITSLQAEFVGSSQGPTFSGGIGLNCDFGNPVTATITANADFTYVKPTKYFEANAYVAVTGDSWFNSVPSAELKYARSPLLRRFSLGLGTSNMNRIVNPKYIYDKKRASANAQWDPASHRVQATLNTGWSSVPTVDMGITFDGNGCIDGELASTTGPGFNLWGATLQYPFLRFTHCNSGSDAGFAFECGGRLNLGGSGVSTFAQQGAYQSDTSDTTGASGPGGTLSQAMTKQVPSGLGSTPIDIMIAIGGPNAGLNFDIHLGSTATDLEGQMPFPTQNHGIDSKVAIRIPFPLATGASVELHLPSMAFNTGPRTTWKAAMVYVRGIGRKAPHGSSIPDFGLEWQFTTKFPDHDGAISSASPEVDFLIFVELNFAAYIPVFILYGHMASPDWIPNAFGLNNFGVKGIALTIGLSSAPPYVVMFGFGATACLYKGKKVDEDGPHLTAAATSAAIDTHTVLGIAIGGQIDVSNLMNNCFYFEATSFTFSEFCSFIFGKNVQIPAIIDLDIKRLMFAVSTKAAPERCMNQGPPIAFGVAYAIDMVFLGFDLMAEMMFSVSNYVPSFSMKFSLTNNGALADLRKGIEKKVENAYNWFKSKCKQLWFPLDKICAAAAWLVKKLFDWLISALFDIFVFYHLKVDIPDISQIFSGGSWPSMALKFKIIGIMIDININLGNILGALWNLLVQAFEAVQNFVGFIQDAISNWFSNIKDVISIEIKSCRNWTNGCENRKKCDVPFCKRRRRWGGWGKCKSILCKCLQWKKKKNILCGFDFSERRRRAGGIPTPPPPTPLPGMTQPTPPPAPTPLVGPCDTSTPCTSAPHPIDSVCHNSGPSSFICACAPGLEEIPGTPCALVNGIGTSVGLTWAANAIAARAPSTHSARRLDVNVDDDGGFRGGGPATWAPFPTPGFSLTLSPTSFPTSYPTPGPTGGGVHRRRRNLVASQAPVRTITYVAPPTPPTPAPTICGRPSCGVRPPSPPFGTYDQAANTQEAADKANAAAMAATRRRRSAIAATTCAPACTSGFWSPAVNVTTGMPDINATTGLEIYGNPCAGPGMCVDALGFCTEDVVKCATGHPCDTCAQPWVAAPTPAPTDPHFCPDTCKYGGDLSPTKPCMGCMTNKGDCIAMHGACEADYGYKCTACNPMTDADLAAELAADDTHQQQLDKWNNDHNAGTGVCPSGGDAVCSAGSTTAHCGLDLSLIVPNTCTIGQTGSARSDVTDTVLSSNMGGSMTDSGADGVKFASENRNNFETVLQADPNIRHELNDMQAQRTAEITGNTVAQELAAVKANDDDVWVEPPMLEHQDGAVGLGQANEDLLSHAEIAAYADDDVALNATPAPTPPPPTSAPTNAPTNNPTPQPTPVPPTPIPNACATVDPMTGLGVCSQQPHPVGSTCLNTPYGVGYECNCAYNEVATPPTPCIYTGSPFSGTAPAPSPVTYAPAPSGLSIRTRRLAAQQRMQQRMQRGALVRNSDNSENLEEEFKAGLQSKFSGITMMPTPAPTPAPTNAPNCGWWTCQPI
jgi:predicted chitinase